MKRLILLRHAKSDWKAAYEGDHERPLAPRGRAAARRVGHFVTRLGLAPDLVLSSTAVRARDTARLAKRSGGWSCAIETRAELYEASPDSLLALLRTRPLDETCLLVSGHEPTISELGSRLIGGGDLRMPTAAMARIDLAVETWADVDAGCGTLLWLVTPKLLRRVGLSSPS